MTAKLNRRDLLKMGAGVLSASWAIPAAFAFQPTRASGAYPQRVIHFPCNMGWIQPMDDPDIDSMVDASGDVTLPAGVPGRLYMLSDNYDAFPRLRTLKPDDLGELLCWFNGGIVRFDHLAHLSGLRTLEITDTTVTGGIALHRFPRLESLTLYRTGVSTPRVAELRRNFPHVHIDWQR